MAKQPHLTRRGLLRHSAALAGAGIVLGTAGPASASQVAHRWRLAAARVLPHRESAAALGRLCLRTVGAPSALVAQVIARLQHRSAAALDGRDDPAIMLDVMSADYAESRVVVVEGWTLSETEVAFLMIVAEAQPAGTDVGTVA